ncbi:MAG: T9SS type A sorting domain-containing protein, partial [bacterium]
VSFVDSILFISNSIKDPQLNNGNPIDSVCIIAGNGTTVGVQDNSINKNLYIYPVPASDKIEIISESEIKNIKVFDILGCERNCHKAIEEGRSIVNLAALNEGIYIAVLSVVTTDSEERTIIKKFIVRK